MVENICVQVENFEFLEEYAAAAAECVLYAGQEARRIACYINYTLQYPPSAHELLHKRRDN